MSEPSTASPQGGILRSAMRLYGAGFMRCLPLALIGSACIALAGNEWTARPPAPPNPLDSLDQLESLDLNSLDLSALQSLTNVHGLLASYFTAATIRIDVLLTIVFVVFWGALSIQLDTVDGVARRVSSGAALLRALQRAPAALISCVLWLIVSVGCLALLAVPNVSANWVLLLSLPCIYWSGRLQFWLPPNFVEQASAWAALRKSWMLTRSLWWRSVIELSIALMVIGIFKWIIDQLVASPSQDLVTGAAVGWRALLTRAQFIDWLLDAVLFPTLPAALLVIYRDLQRVQIQTAKRQLETTTTG